MNFFDEKVNLLNNKQCLIIGDININLLDQNNSSETLKNILVSNNFYLCNDKYSTRYSESTKSLLDHIALNHDYNEISLDIIENCLSDHAIQILKLVTNKSPSKGKITTQHRNINKINHNLLIQKLNTLTTRNNHSFNASELYNSIVDAYSSSSYTKKIKLTSNSKPWFDKKIFNLIKQRDFYYYRK